MTACTLNGFPVERRRLDELVKAPWNPRKISAGQQTALRRSLAEFGTVEPVIVNRTTNHIVGGHQRLDALVALGETETDVLIVELPAEKEKALNIALNQIRGEWDWPQLEVLIKALDAGGAELDVLGFDEGALAGLLADVADKHSGTLFERFLVPPLSVLNGRAGYWVERKRRWLEAGLRSQAGREQTQVVEYSLAKYARGAGGAVTNVSVFDPLLCEVVYRWFCPARGAVLDPFAGGSVRGVVAAACGLTYTGMDLSAPQVAANAEQWAELLARGRLPELRAAPVPVWRAGDARTELHTFADAAFDLVFSCPPYGDLEVYSDDPRDLSAMPRAEFFAAYADIIAQCVRILKPNRCAAFVVSDFRDRQGFFCGLLRHTIDCFETVGARFYNELVYLNPVGSWAVKAGRQFGAGRKVARTHQNVLLFFKGDPAAIKQEFGAVDAAEILPDPDGED